MTERRKEYLVQGYRWFRLSLDADRLARDPDKDRFEVARLEEIRDECRQWVSYYHSNAEAVR